MIYVVGVKLIFVVTKCLLSVIGMSLLKLTNKQLNCFFEMCFLNQFTNVCLCFCNNMLFTWNFVVMKWMGTYPSQTVGKYWRKRSWKIRHIDFAWAVERQDPNKKQKKGDTTTTSKNETSPPWQWQNIVENLQLAHYCYHWSH